MALVINNNKSELDPSNGLKVLYQNNKSQASTNFTLAQISVAATLAEIQSEVHANKEAADRLSETLNRAKSALNSHIEAEGLNKDVDSDVTNLVHEIQTANAQTAGIQPENMSINELDGSLNQLSETSTAYTSELQKRINRILNHLNINPRLMNVLIISIQANIELMNLNNEAALLATQASDKLNEVLDKLSALANLLTYLGKFYKECLAAKNKKIMSSDKGVPLPSISWDDNEDEIFGLAGNLDYTVLSKKKNNKDYLDAICIEYDKCPEMFQQFGVPYWKNSQTSEEPSHYTFTRDSLKDVFEHVSRALAVVLPDQSTNLEGGLYATYSGSIFDSALIDSVSSIVANKTKAINDLISNIPNRVALLQANSQTLQRGFDSLMGIINQLMGRI